MLLIALMTLITSFIVVRNAKKNGILEREEFKLKYGTFTQELDLSSPYAIYYYPFILTRWIITIVILILLRESPSLQLIFLYFLSVIT